jgi:hypothetical protein
VKSVEWFQPQNRHEVKYETKGIHGLGGRLRPDFRTPGAIA